MKKYDVNRIVVIGNSGSGKSWLAEQLQRETGMKWTDWDSIHWLADGYNKARERTEVIRMAKEIAVGDQWIMEGIYGWIATEITDRATMLLWLDIGEKECVANIRQRGPRGGASEQSFADLLVWAGSYCSRDGSSARIFHQSLFEGFAGTKIRLCSRKDVRDLMETVTRQLSY